MGSEAPGQRLERRLEELAAANELIRTLASTLELPEILRLVLERIKTLTQAEALSLLLCDAERNELVFAATETLRENAIVGLRIPAERSIAGSVLRTGRSELVADVSADPRFYAEVDRIAGFSTRSLLAVPIKSGARVIGVLELANRSHGAAFSDADRARLEALLAALPAAESAEGLAGDAGRMRAILARVAATVPSEAASLLLVDAAGRELVFRASRTLQAGMIDGLRLRMDQGIAGWVATNRRALRLDDVAHDPRHDPRIAHETGLVPRSMLCVPMISKDTLRGVIQVINKVDGSSFSDEELRFASTLADHAAIAIENASLYRQAYLASITDDLTGLGNTRHFNRTLPEMLARGGPVSLLVLDLDNFKSLVDSAGHLAGSRTIGHLGRAIGRILRPGDVAARFGGDEFVVVLPATGAEAAVRIAEEIRRTIEASRTLEDGAVDISGVTASVGVATFPDHAGDAESLFRAADGAMYAVKRRAKNAVALAAPPRR